MFSPRDSASSACSLGTDDDSFGWWIGAESHESQTTEDGSSIKTDEPSQQPQSVSSEASCAASSSEDSLGASSDNYKTKATPTATQDEREETESIELKLLVDDEDAEIEDEYLGYVRRDGCYTPERLVKCEEFRILTPSPRFYPSLAELETAEARLAEGASEERNGAAHLARLLQSPQRSVNSAKSSWKRCCPVRYGNGEVVLHTEHCPQDWSKLADSQLQIYSVEYETCYTSIKSQSEIVVEEEKCRRTKDAQSKIADDSSGISSVDGITGTRGDDWSCSSEDGPQSRLTSRRVSSELAYVSLEYGPGASEVQNDEKSDASDEKLSAFTALQSSKDSEIFKARLQRIPRAPSPDTEYLARLALAVEPDVRLPSIRIIPTDTEAEIERLRDRVDRLQGNNKVLYEEISSLKRDFAIDECKVNHLSEDVNKLQTEVHELRCLDDLLKLLKGELERISERNWPFAIGNTKSRIEEINLVI